jgi:asparagine synthetase B (glutamine-hydrolysing)
MIFDFYLSVNLKQGSSNWIEHIKFKNEPFYKDIKGTEESVILKNGYSTCLYRRNYSDSFYQKKDLKLWIFGYVFTNKKYAESKGRAPWKLDAGEILDLYLSDNKAFIHNLKGSYVLVILDEINNTVKVLTDKLNVLPLYYAYENGKLIICSNTALILKTEWVSKEPDTLAFAMQNLFDYMLGDHYFVKGIKRIENACIYFFDRNGLGKAIYWDVSDLYHKILLNRKESLNMLAEQLAENVNLYSTGNDKVLVSLTGGFDGRANLAMLKKPLDSYKCYSYGMPGSTQIKIPQKIAEETGIHYEPVYLDREFLDKYYENTLKASYFSNGSAPIGFNNLPFAYSKLNSYSDTILTGLFGSEILRPLYNGGIQVNDQSFSIFLNDNLEQGLERAYKNISPIKYFSKELLDDSKGSLKNYLNENFFDKYQEYDKVTRFFFFIIQEGIRKYFSQEISIERVYVTTCFPYFDTDMIDLIYQTPWAGMYNGFLRKSKFKRRKGQILYTHIFNKYMPALGKIILDRGYKPDDLILPFPFNYLKIGVKIWREKIYMKNAGGNDTFKTEIWADSTIKRISLLRSKLSDSLFKDRLKQFHDLNKSEREYLTYRHMISINLFNQLLDK